ncbi:MAG: VWA domain-containing protein, partial [Myxococcales bacterium]|nr:VWA domain-containing protein [Myxococcales bacterium]
MSRPGNPAAIAVVAIALAVGLAPSRAAHAGDDDPLGLKRITVDRVEVTPSVLHGLTRLRVFVNAIDLETAGSVLDVAGKKTWTLEGTGLKNVPYLAGTFDGADAETAIVFVIQATDANPADLPKDKASVQLDVAGDLASIKKAIHEQLLDHLPSSTQVAVLGYGEDVTAARLTSAKQAGDQLDKIQLAEATDAPVLLTAVERGLRLLKKATPSTEGAAPESLRRILVVVSDGRDATDDRDRVTRIGKQADRQGVRIDSVAYSPVFRRRPMLTLGELSKRSQGVFRWVPQKIGDASFAHPFQKLLEEIRRQYVLTLFVPSDTVPRRLTVATTLVDRPLRSAPARLPAPGCGEDECGNGQYCVEAKCVRRATEGGRGVLGWILLIGGIALGGLVVLVGPAALAGLGDQVFGQALVVGAALSYALAAIAGRRWLRG